MSNRQYHSQTRRGWGILFGQSDAGSRKRRSRRQRKGERARFLRVEPLEERALLSLAGLKTVGPTGDFASITAVVQANQASEGPNKGALSGPLVVELQPTYVSSVESFPLNLSNFQGVNSTNTITIRPASGATNLLINNSDPGDLATISLDAASFVTIDGRAGGTGTVKNLTIGNTNTSGVAIQFINESSNNTVKYATVKGVATSNASGVIVFGASGPNGNDNNTIDNCDIGDGATTPTNSIYSLGSTVSTAQNNSGNVVSNSNIFNFYASAATDSAGVRLDAGNTDWTITGNSFYQTSSRAGVAGNVRGIYVNTLAGNNFSITSNIIGGSAANAGGTAWTTTSTTVGNKFVGIQLNIGSTTPSSVQGNSVKNFAWSSNTSSTAAPGVWSGVYVQAGSINIGTTVGNTIGGSSGTGSISVTTSGTGGAAFGIAAGNSTALAISNNTIGSITTNGISTSVSASLFGIDVAAGTNTIANNTIGSTTTANSLNVATASTSATGQQITGIRSSSGISASITNNTIANLNNNYIGTAAGGQVRGIFTSGGSNTITGNTVRNLSTTSAVTGTAQAASAVGIADTSVAATGQTVAQNVVHSLVNTASTAAVTVTGINFEGPISGSNLIARNLVHSLVVSSNNTVSSINGMQFSSANFTAQNNMVRVGLDASGTSVAGSSILRAIYDSATSNNARYYHNSVFVGGTQTAGAASTFAFSSDGTTNARVYQDNAFANTRTNGAATSKHYAIRDAGAVVNPAGLVSNGNLLFVTGASGYVGLYGGADRATLISWQSATGQDAGSLSVDPKFVEPTADTPNLHVQINSPVNAAGILVAAVTDDFDGETRSALTPVDIGADAFTPTTISAVLDGNGNLAITDVDPIGKNNNLTVVKNGSSYSISDANEPFGTAPAGGTLSNGNKTLTITIPGRLTVNGGGGNDLLTVDFSAGNPIPAGGIQFNGGENAGDDDRLKLSGYSLTSADGTPDVTVTHTGPESGSVDFAGLGTVGFAETEPLVLAGTAADLVVTLPAGPNLDATLGDDGIAPFDGVNTANTSAIYDSTSPYSFEYTEFTNPTNTLKINRGSASDNLTVQNLVTAGLNAGLTIGAAGSEFNAVTFSGSYSPTSGKNLSVNATGTIRLDNGNLTTSGSGTIDITTAKNIVVGAGTSIVSASGTINLSANRQATSSTGNFIGIDVDGAIIKSTSGDITLAGSGGTTGSSLVGVYFHNAALVGQTTAGKLTIIGSGGSSSGDGFNVGVAADLSSEITTGGGDIAITGGGGNSATSGLGPNHGVSVDGTIKTVGSGKLTITGNGAATPAGAGNIGVKLSGNVQTAGGKLTLTGGGDVGVQIDGVLSAGADVDLTGTPVVSGGIGIKVTGNVNTFSAGNIKFIADGMNLGGTISPENRAVMLLPKTASRAINLGGVDSGTQLGLTGAELNAITAGTLNIGDSASGAISVTSDITRVAATIVNLTSGGGIGFVSGLINTALGGATLAPGGLANVSFAKSGSDLNVGAGGVNFVSGADLAFAIDGVNADTQYEALNVAGNVNLTGTDLVVSGGYTPAAGDTFAIVKYSGTRTGAFSNGTVVLNGRTLNVVYDDANKQVLLSLPAAVTGTLSATLTGGNLTIADTDATGKNNNLTVSASGGNLVITDAVEQFASAPASGALSNGNKTLTIPLTAVNGLLTVNAAGGSDSLTLDLTTGNPFPAGGIAFNGGNPTTGPGDVLFITGGSQGTVTYNYTNAHDGSVAMSNFGTVNYTGLEPIVNSGSATDVVFNLPTASANAVTLGDDGTSGNALSRLSGTTFETTTFANPTGTLTMNRGNVADTLVVNALPDFTAGLTIGSAATPFGAVTFAGTVTLATNKSVAASVSGGISLPNSASDLVVSGTGTVALTSAQNISLNSGSSITSVNGSITLSANQQATPTSGDFAGIGVDGGTVQSTGTGDVTLMGRGGDSSGGSQRGIRVASGGIVSGGTAGTVMVIGKGGAGSGDFNGGVRIAGSTSRIGSQGANIVVVGTGGTGSSQIRGVSIESGQIIAGGSGAVSVTGTGGSGTLGDSQGIYVIGANALIGSTSGDITLIGVGGGSGGSSNAGVSTNQGGSIQAGGTGRVLITGTAGNLADTATAVGIFATSSVTTAGGDILITGIPVNPAGFGIHVDGALTAGTGGNIRLVADRTAITSGGNISAPSQSVTLLPNTAGLAIDVGGVDTATSLGLSDSELDLITAGTINIGDANSGTITVSAAIDRAAGSTTAIKLTTGGNNGIAFSGSGSLDAKNGDVTLLTNSSGNGSIISGSATVDISGGNVSLTGGSGGIGASGNPLVFAATNVNAATGGNGSQFLSASGTTTIDATGLSAGTGTIELDGGTFSLGGSNRINDTTKLNVNGGTLAVGASSETVSGVTLTSGSITGSSGVLTSNSTIQTKSGSISAILAGSVGLTQTTAGTTTLSGASTYSGDTTISGGTLKLGAAGVIPDGSGKGNVVLNPTSGTATLDLGGFSETINGITKSGGGSGVVDNSVTGGSVTFTVGGNNQNSSYSGVIRNTGGSLSLEKIGTGTLTLSNTTNAYSGTTTINQGTLKASTTKSIPETSDVTVATGATLDLGADTTIGALNGNGLVKADSFAIFTVTNGGNYAGSISGSIHLAVNGSGKMLTLGGTNTYIGPTQIVSGTLLVNGTNTGGGFFSVESGATLGGTGTINPASATGIQVLNGGHLAPGTGGVGVLSSKTFNLAPSANFDVTLNGTVVGAQYSQQNVTGSVIAGPFTTLNVTLGFTPAVGNTFTIINNDTSSDAVGGTFNGLPEGAILNVTTGSFSAALQISYVGGDGNDVVLKALSTTNPVLDGLAGNDAWLVKKNAGNGNTDISLNGTLIWSAAGLTGITFNGQNGNDLVTVDLSAGNVIPSSGIAFNGGENTGDDDRLKITGYNLLTADGVADVTVAHTGPEAGSVVLAGLGTVFFTQIEPLALAGTAADLVITLSAGPNPDATLGDDGVAALGDATNDANTSAVYDSTSPRSFEYTEFSNPTNTLKINRGSATDNLTVLDLVASGLDAGLTIGAAGAEFNAVTFNGPMTLATNGSLSANAVSTITLAAAAKLAVSGTGGVSLTTARDISQALGSTITTVNGAVNLSASHTGTISASFVGITIAGSVTTSGTGAIIISGRGGDLSASNYGVWINGGQIKSIGTSASAGGITITGTSGTATGTGNVGVEMDTSTASVASVNGNISITGTSNGTTTISQDGIRQTVTARIDITGTATLTLTGTPGVTTGGNNGVGLRLAGLMDVTGSQTTLISNRMAFDPANFSLNTHGNTALLRPLTNGTPIDLGSTTETNATVTLELSDAELDKITTGTLQIGNANSGTISITNVIGRPALTNVSLVSGGSINFISATNNGSINTTNGNLSLAPAATGSVGVASTITDVNMGTTGTVGTLSFVSGTDLAIAINGQIQGSDYQQLTLTGNVNLANVDLKLTGTYKPAIGDKFTIVNNTKDTAPPGVTSGIFNGLTEGMVFNPAAGNLNADLYITYKGVGGVGNDVILTAINVAPTLNAISDPVTILEGAGLQTINLSGITAGGTQSQTLTVSATSSNPTLITSPISVNYTSPGSTGSLSYTPEPGQFGTAVITVTVKDNGGVFGSLDQDTIVRTFTVRVAEVNDAPTGMDDTLANIAEDSGGHAIPFDDLVGNDLKGPDNESSQTLTITAVNNVVGGAAVIQGANVVFTPTADYHGPASFVYTLRDNGTTNGVNDFKTSTATVTFSITEVNDPPVAGNDFPASSAEDTARTISIASLLLNDSPGPSDESGQNLSLTAVGFAIGGVATIDGNNIVFIPTADYNGPVNFTYTVRDDGTTNGVANPKSSTATVSFTITEVNDRPVGTNDSLGAVTEDFGNLTIPASSLLANDSTGGFGFDEQFQTLTITAVSNPVGGTVQISGANIIFTPTANYNGPASFIYTLRDNGTTNGAADFLTSTATVSFTITEKNDAPIGTNDPLTSIAEDSGDRTISIASLLSNDGKGPADEAGQTLTIVSVASAVGGTVQIDGANIVFTPTADYNGPASFVYTLRDDGTTNGTPDPQNATATVSFTITEKNDAPTGVNDPLSAIAEDSGNRVIVIADLLSNDLKGPANESGQTLTIVSVGSAVGGTVQINGASVVFSPAADYNGPASFVYTLRDDGTTNGASDFLTSTATVSFTITEKNDPPTGVDDFPLNIAEDAGPQSFSIDELLSNDLTGPSNESGQTLTLDTVGAAIGGTVQIVGQNVVFTPTADYNGPASFQYTFHDDGTTNGSADPRTGSATVSFTIFEVNDPPTAGNDSLPAITEDFGPFPIFLADLLANDSKGPANEASQVLTFLAPSGVVGGTAQISGSQITFRPADDFNGTASFVYSLRDNGTTDGVLDAKTATAAVSFRVTEINDVPIGHHDSLTDIPGNFGPRTISFADLLGNDEKGPANESNQSLTIIDVSGSVGGTVEINALDQTIIFTPAANFQGPASFFYTLQDDGTTNGVLDARSGTTTVTFNITETNDPPTGTDDTLTDIAEDSGPLTIAFATLLGNDSPGPADEASQTLTIINVGSAVGGTVSINGTNVVFEPTPDYFGVASFVYTLRDNGQTNGSDDFLTATATVHFNITPVNDPSSFAILGNQSAADENPATKGPALRQTVSAFAENIKAGPANEAGQPLSFKVAPANTNLFTATGQPTIDPVTGNLTFQPKPNVSGTTTITVELSDDGGVTFSPPQTFSITITKTHKFHNAAELGTRNGRDTTGSLSAVPNGQINATDALAVINFLNANPGQFNVGPGSALSSKASPPYVDVDGDDQVVPGDALSIINYINAGGAQEGEATSSLAESSFVDLIVTDLAITTPSTTAQEGLGDLIALLASDAAASQSKRRRMGS